MQRAEWRQVETTVDEAELLGSAVGFDVVGSAAVAGIVAACAAVVPASAWAAHRRRASSRGRQAAVAIGQRRQQRAR